MNKTTTDKVIAVFDTYSVHEHETTPDSESPVIYTLTNARSGADVGVYYTTKAAAIAAAKEQDRNWRLLRPEIQAAFIATARGEYTSNRSGE